MRFGVGYSPVTGKLFQGFNFLQNLSSKSISGKTGATVSLYWWLAALLFGLQAVYSFRSMNQIRYEELMESVRNVYLLQHRIVYNGASTNIGWYGLLLFVYNCFGFGLHTAKIVRLAIHLVSIFCLAGVLRNLMGAGRAWLPLITIELSPIFLYFSMMQGGYGFDLQYFPICLFLVTKLNFDKKWLVAIIQIALWGLVMIACTSYPVFILYLPVLIILYLRQLGKRAKMRGALYVTGNVLLSIAAFMVPLLVGFLYVKNRSILVYDPVTTRGLFRGGGGIKPDLSALAGCLKVVFRELVVRGQGYHFELSRTEFSGATGIIPVAFVMIAGIVLFFTRRSLRLVLLLSWLLLVLNLILPNLDMNAPGIRRCTGILAAIYAVYAIVWYYLTGRETRPAGLKWAGILICLLLPIHHLLAYPENLSNLDNPSIYRVIVWYDVKSTPSESLDFWLKHTEEGKGLMLIDGLGRPVDQYEEIYYALAGYRWWNHLKEKPIMAYDGKSGKYIPLSVR